MWRSFLAIGAGLAGASAAGIGLYLLTVQIVEALESEHPSNPENGLPHDTVFGVMCGFLILLPVVIAIGFVVIWWTARRLIRRRNGVESSCSSD